MHPEIRAFPSKSFYLNKLVDHESVMERERNMHPSLKKLEELFQKRVILFDLQGNLESTDARSKRNDYEALLTQGICQLFDDLTSKEGS